MPTKLKPSIKKSDRATKKIHVEHFYMKAISEKELLSLYNDERTKPKIKIKILNELNRRSKNETEKKNW